MPDHLLYFPYINVPDTYWTYRSLLYYETISAIVPESHNQHPEKYEQFMHTLVDRNLVISINPRKELQQYPEFNDTFIEFISNTNYTARADVFQQLLQIPDRPLNTISREKFNGPILHELTHLGLARLHDDDHYEVESVTARFLMSALAGIIAQKRNLFPVTDEDGEDFGIKVSFRGKNISDEETARRNEVLKAVMPGPRLIELDKLLEFKMKYKSELFHFRNTIEQIALDDKFNNPELLSLKIKELVFYKELLVEQMHKSKWEALVFKDVTGFLSAIAGFFNPMNWLGLLSSTADAASATYEATEKATELSHSSGMQYMAFVEKHL
jgi:hypothetical protein